MSSFEPIVIVYGSPTSILSANLRLPISMLFAFDVKSLENIVHSKPDLSNPCLHRYFLILLQSINQDLLIDLQLNHRIISIYNRETSLDENQEQLNQMTNSFKQLTLDLTNDISRFLTLEGEKNLTLERIHLVKIYYQQARVLKEWAMAFFKAEPSHILLISLNSTQLNLNSAQQKLQQICTNLGYNSTIIRQLNDYIPHSDRHSSLLPYSKLLFHNENPRHICQLIKKLSPIRLYLYGNQLGNLNEWSKLMIENEKELMDDEDSWSAFIENEFVDNDVKWNFAFMVAREWKVSRVAPLDLKQLNDDPRFHSALRRAHMTFAERQIEVTADIYDWYAKCIEQGYLQIEPKLTPQQETMKSGHRPKSADELVRWCIFRDLSSFDYLYMDSPRIDSISFIWLDEILQNPDGEFYRIIEPFHWQFFDNVSSCTLFIEKQLREQRYIFLIASGTLGRELFFTTQCLMRQIFATYVYCAHLAPHCKWTKQHSQIRGVFNDSRMLAKHIKIDLNQLQNALKINRKHFFNRLNINQQNKILYRTENDESLLPLPLTIYNSEEAHLFMSYQRTIDTLLCMPHTYESKKEMIDEFRRTYNDNPIILDEIENFEKTYNSSASVHWYARDSFVYRTINEILRLSDVDQMFKVRYILTDLYNHLNQSYEQNYSSYRQFPSEIYYRGQLMSNKEFDYFKELQGNIISINTFLSTTRSMQIALMYAGKYHGNPSMTSVVFSIERDSSVNTRPYANISYYSLFPDEEETLFAIGSVFRIGNIRQLTNEDDVWIIHLKMTDQHDSTFIKTNSTTS